MMEKKIQNHIEKAEKLLAQNKPEKALEHFLKACELDSENSAIYEKLIQTHKLIDKEWTENDFNKSMAWTMKKLEIEDPKFKRIHATMTSKSQEILELTKKLLIEKDEKIETEIVEKIVSCGEDALYPLIEMLLTFKNIGRKK